VDGWMGCWIVGLLDCWIVGLLDNEKWINEKLIMSLLTRYELIKKIKK